VSKNDVFANIWFRHLCQYGGLVCCSNERVKVYLALPQWNNIVKITSCARGDTICPAPLLPVGAPAPRAPPSRRNVAVVFHAQYDLTVTAAPASRVKAAAVKAALWPSRGLPLCQWPFDPESGARVTCHVGYLCANFCLPRLLCCRLRPEVRDRRQTARRQTDVRQLNVRQKHRFMLPPIRSGDTITTMITTIEIL